MNRMVLKALLGQLGIEPTLVENGEEAVRAWRLLCQHERVVAHVRPLLVVLGSDLLDKAHPMGLFGTPVVAGQHVAHGVSPSGFPGKSDRRAATRKPSVRVLILAKPHVSAGHPDVGHQMQFVAHVPGVAMDNGEERLGEDGRRPGQGVDGSRLGYTRSIGCYSCLKGIDINAP